MSVTQTARLLTPEEIAVQAGQQIAFLRVPERTAVFADRELRLRQLAAGHPMGDYLRFIAEVTRAQHALLQEYPHVFLPTPQQLEAAARTAEPPLPAGSWSRDSAWRAGLARMLDQLLVRVQDTPARETIQALRGTPAEAIEIQADRLLNGVMLGLDLGTAPLIAAALQTYWTHLVIATAAERNRLAAEPFGRTTDATLCPCCGSRPTASITRIGGNESGYRYLHCSLCSSQWHMVRIKCAVCETTKGIAYQSLEPRAGHTQSATGAAKDAVQAETCEECRHYLKIVHMEKDNQVEPVADDLASVTLDLLVSESGHQRRGVNLMLLFGDPDPPPIPGAT
ncbi:MAG TPA: formate dehydrogenase accessory protein FdhE [Burkholderiaceae bacterium]|nr:formate dehydrogenase accessory protein FdhE [Burkholderiaceae bacterium]